METAITDTLYPSVDNAYPGNVCRNCLNYDRIIDSKICSPFKLGILSTTYDFITGKIKKIV